MKAFKPKFKTRLVLLLIGIFLLSSLPSFAQSLKGKWNIAKKNTRHSTVLQFTEDSLMFYEFDKRHSATAYQVKGDSIAVDSGSIPIDGKFQFVNPQRLRLKPDRAKHPIDFVQLIPTKTNLTKTEMEQLNFNIKYQNHTIPVNFDGVQDESGKTVQLENIDATYFLTFYQKNKRMGAMPIEKVTPEKIIVYGFPEKPYKVTGKAAN